MISSRIAIPLGALGLGLVVGLTLGWKLYRPKPAPKETAAPAIQQADGSTVLGRKPEAKPEPHHELPKGSTLERQVSLEVLPFTPTADRAIPSSGTLKPVEPIHVDLSLVKMQDGTQRVIASSTNGTIVGGLDIPVQPPAPVAKDLKWAAGGSWNPSDRTYGAWIDRNAGPFVVGAEVNQVRASIAAGGALTYEGRIRVGIRW